VTIKVDIEGAGDVTRVVNDGKRSRRPQSTVVDATRSITNILAATEATVNTRVLLDGSTSSPLTAADTVTFA
jgi:hypothetical protein